MKAATGFLDTPRRRFLVAALLAVAIIATYANSLRVPFLFDDRDAIVENSTLENFRTAFTPPTHGETVSGRPVLNLSFALNRAVGGLDVRGYHAVNLAIHFLAALTLFGLVRRTLFKLEFPSPATAAFASTLLWALHPLNTSAVTYLAQRAESLAALFSLITLYAFVRSADSVNPRRWQTLSVVSCALGLATKETVAVAPMLVLLYDRTFRAGTWRAALHARRTYYSALAVTWLLPAALMLGDASRGGTAGWNTEITATRYALTQCHAIIHYLRLAAWPKPLVFDYGTAVVANISTIWPSALLLAGLLVGTALALWRRPAFGFLAASFFLLLAPSSSVVPIATQTIAEHRMYLPLAALTTLIALSIRSLPAPRALALVLAPSVLLGFLTVSRNRDYHGELALWSDTAAKLPSNARAHVNLSTLHLKAGDLESALTESEIAVHLAPLDPAALDNRAIVLAQAGRVPEALTHFESALRLAPTNADAHYNFANTLAQSGRLADALTHYEEALRLRPASPEFHSNFANALLNSGRPEDALAHYRTAIQFAPDKADFHTNLGNALAWSGQLSAAVAEFEQALRLEPGSARAHNNLGNTFATLNRLPEALIHYEAAVRLSPTSAEYHDNLGGTLAQQGRVTEALPHFEAAVRLQPTLVQARHNLGIALVHTGRFAEAAQQFEEALRLQPDFTPAREKLELLQSLTAPLHKN